MLLERQDPPDRDTCVFTVGRWGHFEVSAREVLRACSLGWGADYVFQNIVRSRLRPFVWLSMPGHE